MKVNFRPYIVLALMIVGGALLLRSLAASGILDGHTGTRAFMMTMGLMIAVFGNIVPKSLKAPRRAAAAEQRTQAALRAVGWAMTAAGLIYAVLWMAAPLRFAQPVSLGVLAIAFAFTVYRIVACRAGGARASIETR